MSQPQAAPGLAHTAQISSYFANRRREKPAVDQPAPVGRIPGWLEWLRAESFQTLAPSDPVLRGDQPWSSFRSQIFLIAQRSLSAILAVYGPTDILWLDDHTDEADFSQFVGRENLLRWLPERSDEFARLICETRLNYLGHPRLVTSAAEIPGYSEADKAGYQRAGMAETLEIVLDSERRLASVADRIRPLTVAQNPDGAVELACNLWTPIMGRLIRVQARIDPQGACRFEGEELARFVGKGYVPR